MLAITCGDPCGVGPEVLLKALALWFTNAITFGLWFWELDGGGPLRRAAGRERIEFQLDCRVSNAARKLAKRSGASTIQEWLKLVVHRAVQDAELYR